MPEYQIEEIARIIEGSLEVGEDSIPQTPFAHYHFDTRLITQPQTLFFAFKTETGDGHQFLPNLEGKPGIAAVISRDYAVPETHPLSFPLIRVDDPLNAAHKLAAHVRNSLGHIKTIGVTGSAGKTTTKEFIYQLLSHKYNAYRSYKNWNNWIGMPFSILNMTGKEEAAVFELAMSYPGIGEIDQLARILKPNLAIILNVYPAHMEFLKTLDNTAIAKSEIMNYQTPEDITLINADSEPLMNRLKTGPKTQGKKLFFGKTAENLDFRLKEIIRENGETVFTIESRSEEIRIKTPLINHLHIENLFAAITVVLHAGMSITEIQEAALTVTPLADRGYIKQHGSYTMIDETYNSNPEALKKTLQWVDLEYQGREKIAVIGEMLELGENENQYRREAGHFFASLHYSWLITVGKRALEFAAGAIEKGFPSDHVYTFPDAYLAGKKLKYTVTKGCVILFKGSRGTRLENAIKEFSE